MAVTYPTGVRFLSAEAIVLPVHRALVRTLLVSGRAGRCTHTGSPARWVPAVGTCSRSSGLTSWDYGVAERWKGS